MLMWMRVREVRVCNVLMPGVRVRGLRVQARCEVVRVYAECASHASRAHKRHASARRASKACDACQHDAGVRRARHIRGDAVMWAVAEREDGGGSRYTRMCACEWGMHASCACKKDQAYVM
eukprot:5987995-Pleurochrysis_carterae.AAC.1